MRVHQAGSNNSSDVPEDEAYCQADFNESGGEDNEVAYCPWVPQIRK